VHFAGVEAGEVDPGDPARPLQLRQPAQQWVAAVELVRAEADGQDDPLRAETAHQERDGLAGGRVGPVDVLDDQQDRRPVRQAMQEAEQRLEDPDLQPLLLDGNAGRHRGERGHEPDEVRPRRSDDVGQVVGIERLGELAQDLGDRGVRQAALAQVGAVATQDAHATLVGREREILDEAGLADARLSRDQQVHRRAGDGTVESAGGRLELRPTTDRDGADKPSGHARDHRNDRQRAGPRTVAARRLRSSTRPRSPTATGRFARLAPVSRARAAGGRGLGGTGRRGRR
jgi:hypothetical protein